MKTQGELIVKIPHTSVIIINVKWGEQIIKISNYGLYIMTRLKDKTERLKVKARGQFTMSKF